MGDEAKVHSLKATAVVALLFVVNFSIFFAGEAPSPTDSKFSMLLGESLLIHRTFDLRAYSVPHARPYSNIPGLGTVDGYPYHVFVRDGHLLYYFPHATSILSVPFLFILQNVGISAITANGKYDERGEAAAQRFIAAVLMAALICITYLTARLVLETGWSLAIALGAALGTPIWSTCSYALWSFDWELVFLALAIFELLRSAKLGKNPHVVWLATLLAWSYFARPTSAIAIVAVSVYLLRCHRSSIFRYLFSLTLWLIAFVIYSYEVFGRLLPDYYEGSVLDHHFAVALANNLFGPSRGLLVYVPIVLFIIYLVLKFRRTIECVELVWLGGAICVAQTLFVSSVTHKPSVKIQPQWWGGWAYGPRVLIDLLPWLSLLAMLGLAAKTASPLTERTRQRLDPLGRSEWAVGCLLLLASVAINYRGARSPAAMDWNAWKDCVYPWPQDTVADLFEEWRYPQFLAALISPPSDADPGPKSRPVIKSIFEPVASGLSDSQTASSNPRVRLFPGEWIMIRGENFDSKHGVAVDLFSPDRKIGTTFVWPGSQLSRSSIPFLVPYAPPGLVALRVDNHGCDGQYSEQSDVLQAMLKHQP